LAEYRAGHWAESIAAAERSIALSKSVDASNWFILAMALCQKGGKNRSLSFFEQAVSWTKKNNPDDATLRAFWREAAELLVRPGPDAGPLPDLPRRTVRAVKSTNPSDPCIRSVHHPAFAAFMPKKTFGNFRGRNP
jgi:hypothetical protein